MRAMREQKKKRWGVKLGEMFQVHRVKLGEMFQERWGVKLGEMFQVHRAYSEIGLGEGGGG